MRTRHFAALVCVAVLVVFIPAGRTDAQTCPPLPNQVITRVKVSLTFDATSSLYTYGYTIANSASSVQAVEAFAIDFRPPVLNITKPSGWSGGVMSGRSTVRWGALRVPNPDENPNDATIIRPSSFLGGFSFQSQKPPGLGRYYAVGYLPPASNREPCVSFGADEDETEGCTEALREQCPQLGRPILEQSASGTTIGPVNATPVRVEVKPGSSPAPVNPKSQGVLPVAILGSSSLDVRTIDPFTIRLGIGQAAPRNGGHIEDVNADGIPDLVLQFPTQDVGILCGDTTVIISGKLASGAAIAGFDTVKTVECL